MPMQLPFGLAAALLALLAALHAPAGAGEPSLKWKGRAYKLSELPAELPKEVAEAARPLAEWTERKGYRMELTPEADCLLIVSRKSSSPDEHFALVRETLAAFDALIAPRVDTPETSGGGGKPARGRLEDFDLPEIGKQEAEMPRLPHQTPVVLEARNAADYKSALAALIESCPWLADWAGETGERANGLVLPRPLFGAWLVDAPGNEEWDPRNELVNRLAQLVLIDRGGVQPYWLLSGVAWDVELAVRKGIYCFPYRDGFVGIEEHGGWSPQLRAKFEARAKEPPTAAEIASLKRGSYVDGHAALAWGTAHWLLKHHAAQLPAILADLDLARRKQGIEVAEDGSWKTIPDWDWPDATLDEILRRHLGQDVFAELGAAFSAGL
jgi:hypothetical protein